MMAVKNSQDGASPLKQNEFVVSSRECMLVSRLLIDMSRKQMHSCSWRLASQRMHLSAKMHSGTMVAIPSEKKRRPA
jgi:hypothetical protein